MVLQKVNKLKEKKKEVEEVEAEGNEEEEEVPEIEPKEEPKEDEEKKYLKVPIFLTEADKDKMIYETHLMVSQLLSYIESSK